ncbi:hypothetical protein BDU57DRAFT_522639 [Ampelomyces quisqualis]|uniref:Uncharacterized protein n=1 Tax=Ampelomyces quisqualis TaxID=50730 RepID=A0A6A5QC19_AMPQU|nr:hypothetical protein BDU57DRAFT_522639 [Ampelomyces quisqualis]
MTTVPQHRTRSEASLAAKDPPHYSAPHHPRRQSPPAARLSRPRNPTQPRPTCVTVRSTYTQNPTPRYTSAAKPPRQQPRCTPPSVTPSAESIPRERAHAHKVGTTGAGRSCIYNA